MLAFLPAAVTPLAPSGCARCGGTFTTAPGREVRYIHDQDPPICQDCWYAETTARFEEMDRAAAAEEALYQKESRA